VRTACQRLFAHEADFLDQFTISLMELVPRLRALDPQRRRSLAEGLGRAVLWAALTDDPPDVVEATFLNIGTDYAQQGFPEEGYHGAGHALLRAARDSYSADWSSELSSGWVAFYGWLGSYLQRGARLGSSAPGAVPDSGLVSEPAPAREPARGSQPGRASPPARAAGSGRAAGSVVPESGGAPRPGSAPRPGDAPASGDPEPGVRQEAQLPLRARSPGAGSAPSRDPGPRYETGRRRAGGSAPSGGTLTARSPQSPPAGLTLSSLGAPPADDAPATLGDVLQLLRERFFGGNERALAAVLTRVALRTGADLRAPQADQLASPVVIGEVMAALRVMGYVIRPEPEPPQGAPPVPLQAPNEPPRPAARWFTRSQDASRRWRRGAPGRSR
jgi:hemoglobin-like flavoprotein